MGKYEHLCVRQAHARPELTRRSPRVIAGVARGLSVHLGGNVIAWRVGFVLASAALGAGIALYVIIALSIPRYDNVTARSRLAQPLTTQNTRIGSRRPFFLISLVLGLTALALILMVAGVFGGSLEILLPVLVIIAGAGLAWSHPVDGDSAPIGLTITGGTIACLGALGLAATLTSLRDAISGLVVGVAVIGALALIIIPVLLGNRTRLREAHEARIRETERTQIAAHLHDSVLQTLALIRSRASEPDEVASLARAQERDLRRYLYADRAEEGSSVAEQLSAIAGEVEILYRGEIDTVITGDCRPSTQTDALIRATREALVNACKHAGDDKISLYAELSETEGEVFVRDRGSGFDINQIPADRAGIRDSITGRLTKVGGYAEIRSPLATGGTEVHMSVRQS